MVSPKRIDWLGLKLQATFLSLDPWIEYAYAKWRPIYPAMFRENLNLYSFVLHTLESRIDIGQGINVGPGKVDKNN